jgi:HPt (histidine-containing phosphotransfer) domain-containing protein
MSTSPQQDRSPLRSTLEGDPDMAELVSLFVGELPQRIAALRQAWDQRRTDDLRRLAHQLRGSCASYGFPIIGTVAGKLEDSIRELGASPSPNLDSLVSTVNELIDLCDRAARR